MKKIICLILCLCVMGSFALPSFSMVPDEEENILKDIDDSLSLLIDKASKVSEVAKDPEALKNVTSTFGQVMKVAGNAATILNIINGSYNFLKMIGIIKDSNEEALKNIQTQLQSMNEKLSEMDAKLDEITTQMSKIQSSVEFNARTEQAILMHDRYTDFSYRYMEEGIDKLITDYESMLMTGIHDWCLSDDESVRCKNQIDNSKIIVAYRKSGNDYSLVYSIGNELPSGLTKDDRYVIISSDALPSSVTWSPDNFNDNIRIALVEKISYALHNNTGDVTLSNCDHIINNLNTKQESYVINNLANDAVNVLLYRIASQCINADSSYVKELIRVYNNYCTHLVSSDDGIDAIYKSYYLTHNFESEIKDDITDFSNRISIKNGVYGLFVMNILGMSFYSTETEKTTAVKNFAKSMKSIDQALENGLTGNDNYCYITNSILSLVNVTLKGSAGVIFKKESNGNTAYKSNWSELSEYEITTSIPENSIMLDSASLLVIEKTAKSNGTAFTFEYLKERAKGSFANNYGKLVTFISQQMKLSSLDGKTTFKSMSYSGDYFPNKNITSLPEDANFSYMKERTKREGTYYDFATGELKTNQVLISVATYGEDHWYWRHCEAAILAGPADYEYSSITDLKGYKNLDDYTYAARATITSNYNTIMSSPVVKESKLQSSDEINPLESFIKLTGNFVKDEVNESEIMIDQTDNNGRIVSIVISFSALALLIVAIVLSIILNKKK